MKDYRRTLRSLVMLTQFGFSIAFPLAGFVLLAVWLRNRFGMGNWILILGVVFGLVGAVDGFRASIKTMDILSGTNKDKKEGDGNGYSHIHHS